MYSISRSTLAGNKQNSEGNNQTRIQSDLVPILFARICTSMGKPETRTIRILLDLGASASIFKLKYLSKLRLKRKETTMWTTAAGNRPPRRASLFASWPEVALYPEVFEHRLW
jgi:hypothetical protein